MNSNLTPHTLGKVSTKRSINLALEYMIEHFAEEVRIEDLALAGRTSKFNLCRIFSKAYGITPIKLLWEFRGHLARTYIQMAPDLDLTDIAFLCGFASSSHFSRYMKRICSMPPSSLRSQVKPCESRFQKSIGLQEIFNPEKKFLRKTIDDCLEG